MFTSLFVSCKKELISENATLNGSSITNATTQGSNITAKPALFFDSLFTRYGGGWTGGDVSYSYGLGKGRSVWLFGDSFLDTVYPDRSRPLVPFIHNTIVVTDAPGTFITLYGGTEKNPEPFFNAKEPKQYWPNCAFTNTSQTKMFVMMVTIKSTGEGGLFGFNVIGNDVGVLSLPDLTLKRIFPFIREDFIDWSSATLEDGEYVYIYGAESTEYNKYMHVCRTLRDDPFNRVEYYDGNSWVTKKTTSGRLQGGVSEQYSVFKYGNKYYLLSQEGILFSDDIYIWNAASPVGRFTNKRRVYTTPQDGGNIITYNALAHTEFINNGKLLVSYNTNSFNGLDLIKDADNYRPYFIWVSNWQ